MKQIYLKRGKEESLLRFHPWVFSGAIGRSDDGIGEGDVVRVLTATGHFIAIGHYQQGSIAVRVLSLRATQPSTNASGITACSRPCKRGRPSAGRQPDNQHHRLSSGARRRRQLPGLIVDVYGRRPSCRLTASACTLPAPRHSPASSGRSWGQHQTASTTRARPPYPSWSPRTASSWAAATTA